MIKIKSIPVKARQHEEYQATIEIKASETNKQDIFISFQAISYSWEVTPTEIEDSYTFELVTDFETHVPEPVVIIDCPSQIMMDSITSSSFEYIISNYGLVSARDVVS